MTNSNSTTTLKGWYFLIKSKEIKDDDKRKESV